MAPPPAALLDAVVKDGWARLASLPAETVFEMSSYLKSKDVRLRGGRSVPAEKVPRGEALADFPLSTVVNCPHVLELANDPLILQLTTAYLGCTPTISSVGLRWSYPAPERAATVQSFHRDTDDWRFLKLFAYLTDVDEGAGPHVFVRGSHRDSGRLFARPYRETDLARDYGEEKIVSVTGRAGTVFVVDTYGVHKGAVPLRTPRLLLEIGYSVLPAFAYSYAPARLTRRPIVLDPYINRLIVAT